MFHLGPHGEQNRGDEQSCKQPQADHSGGKVADTTAVAANDVVEWSATGRGRLIDQIIGEVWLAHGRSFRLTGEVVVWRNEGASAWCRHRRPCLWYSPALPGTLLIEAA